MDEIMGFGPMNPFRMMEMMERRMGSLFDDDYNSQNFSNGSSNSSGYPSAPVFGREGVVDPMDDFMK